MDFDPGFSFDDVQGRAVAHPWSFAGALSQAQKLDPSQTTVDAKISAKLKRAASAKTAGTGREEDVSESDDDTNDDSDALPGEVGDDSDDELEVSGEDSDGSTSVEVEPEIDSQRDTRQAGPQPALDTPGGPEDSIVDDGIADDDEDDDDEVATAAALSQLAAAADAASDRSEDMPSDGPDGGAASDTSDAASDSDAGEPDSAASGGSGPGGQQGDSSGTSADDVDEAAGAGRDRSGGGRAAGGRGGKEREFYAAAPEGTTFSGRSFADLGLSRPLTKAVGELGFATPTPIQAAVVPLALLGRDIVASAITGSGKTAAFALPMLERLLFRQRRVAATHVLVLAPTRELAAQVHSMICQLARFTDIRAALAVGGLSLSQQAAELRTAPEIVVATPGRVIDHVLNTMAFDLDTLSALILDEADRLLELGFQDELRQIIKRAPRKRQTLLFSATMTTAVQQLVDLSLNAPVRLAADATAAAPKRLRHEVLRLRGGAAAADKPAVLCALCARALRNLRTIVFCRQKRQAHRLKIMLGLAGLPPACELHGDMAQAARLEALETFRTGAASLLLATDVAARGLDILGVDAVVNFDCPRTVETYLHRVGRTARAGRGGFAVTLAEDGDRTLLKAVVKQVGVQLAAREVPRAVVDTWRRRVEGLAATIDEVLQEEKAEKAMRMAEMEANKAANLMQHEKEIFSRPRREWFQTPKEKKAAAKAAADATLAAPGPPAAAAPAPKKGAKAAKNAEAKGRQAKEERAAPAHVTETKRVAGAVKAAKSAARQFQQTGSKPREAAKAALTATGAVKKKSQKKRDRESGTGDTEAAAEKVPRVTRVYAGGGKSSKVQAPKTGMSKSQKAKLARKGKGKSQFKGKKKYKRK